LNFFFFRRLGKNPIESIVTIQWEGPRNRLADKKIGSNYLKALERTWLKETVRFMKAGLCS
jgi:hypothetical protein